MNFCKTQPFSVTKIYLETWVDMLITQTRNFQKFEFQTLAGISSNTGRGRSNQIEFTVLITVLVRSTLVAMLLGISTVDASPLSPDPSQEKQREDEVFAQGPLPVIFFPARCRPPL
jgi:hypothetical protein